jgi:hypothetical protein
MSVQGRERSSTPNVRPGPATWRSAVDLSKPIIRRIARFRRATYGKAAGLTEGCPLSPSSWRVIAPQLLERAALNMVQTVGALDGVRGGGTGPAAASSYPWLGLPPRLTLHRLASQGTVKRVAWRGPLRSPGM